MKAHLVIVGLFFFIFGKGCDGKKIISNRDTGLFSKKYQLPQLPRLGLDHSFRPKIVSYSKWNSWNPTMGSPNPPKATTTPATVKSELLKGKNSEI